METITGPDGKEYKAKRVRFTTVSDPEGTYETQDYGIEIKVKTVVMRVLVAVDDNGAPVMTPNGEPLVVIQSQNLVAAEKVA